MLLLVFNKSVVLFLNREDSFVEYSRYIELLFVLPLLAYTLDSTSGSPAGHVA